MCRLRWVLVPSALLADVYAGWVLGRREDIGYAFAPPRAQLDPRDATDWEDGVDLWLSGG